MLQHLYFSFNIVYYIVCSYCIISITIGAFSAFGTLYIKQFLGYLSISTFGFIMLLSLSFSKQVHYILFLYLFLYCLLNSIIFCFLIFFEKENEIFFFSDLFKNKKDLTILYIFLLIFLILSGMPPLVFYFLKYKLFLSIFYLNIKFEYILFFLSLYNILNILIFFNLINVLASRNYKSNINSLDFYYNPEKIDEFYFLIIKIIFLLVIIIIVIFLLI
jgi:NADH:ubiquinone oxidoreductase subunit 2 (subunit N)